MSDHNTTLVRQFHKFGLTMSDDGLSFPALKMVTTSVLALFAQPHLIAIKPCKSNITFAIKIFYCSAAEIKSLLKQDG